MTARVVVHGSRYCLWSRRAEALLRRRGVAFELIDLAGDRAGRVALAARVGKTSVPQIFVDGRHVGGFRELEALDDAGGLEPLREPLLGDAPVGAGRGIEHVDPEGG